MLRPFYLHEPSTVGQAVDLLAGFGEQGRIYAGGTELLLVMKEGLARFKHLINVKCIPGLDDITHEDGWFHIGAAVTHRDLEDSEIMRDHFAPIAEMERNVANIRVRNAGTIGGNLCFAEPHSDPATLLLIYDAMLELEGLGGRRILPLREFILGPLETSLKQDEILTQVRVPSPPQGMSAAYLKFGYHERPTIGVAAAVKFDGDDGIDEVRFAMGSVGDKPIRLQEPEEMLRGREIHEALSLLPKAAESVNSQIQPVTDLYGSESYKRHLVMVFLKRAFLQACQKNGRQGYGSTS